MEQYTTNTVQRVPLDALSESYICRENEKSKNIIFNDHSLNVHNFKPQVQILTFNFYFKSLIQLSTFFNIEI